jgi:hypothetical protein
MVNDQVRSSLDLTEDSTAEDKLDMLVSIQSFSFRFIKDSFQRASADVDAINSGLNVLWFMFVETAKVVKQDDPIQEKLL